MKATGIIRRIDELGRIVIPKEIRKNLRIREGDSLEIYINDSENIVLKKHSALKELKDFASILTDSLYKDLKRDVIITDTDKVLAASGKHKKEYLGKEISTELALAIQRRTRMLEKHRKELQIADKKEEMTYTMSTILVDGDAVGMVIIFDKDGVITEVEEKISYVVSNFLEKHIAQ